MKKSAAVCLLSLSAFLLACPLVAQNIVGTWNLVNGTYNNSAIAGLSATLVITDVNGEDSLNYLASFEDNAYSGIARARYSLEGNRFVSNLNEASFALNGFSSSYTIGPNGIEYVWRTSLNISSLAFNQWGGAAIGYGSPSFSVNGDILTLASQNGNTVLTYERVISKGDSQYLSPEQVRLFPNPSDGKFAVELMDTFGNWQLALYNSQGQAVWESLSWQPAQMPRLQCQLSRLAKGVYWLAGTNGVLSFQKKLVLK